MKECTDEINILFIDVDVIMILGEKCTYGGNK